MRILHAPENIGGMAGVLAKAQSQLGHDAFSYSFSSNHFKFPSDFILDNPNSKMEKIKRSLEFSLEFEVFQFYFGSSLLGLTLKDVKWLHRLGKKIFFYFCGCDIRDEKATIMKYEISACKNCFPKLCSPNRQLAYDVSSKYGRVNFVSTPDLLEFVKRAVLLPQAVDFDIITKVRSLRNLEEHAKESFIIAHAPTNRAIKGSEFIFDTISNLKKQGLNIELMVIENMSHEDALMNYCKADLAIDQLLVGSYGLLSAELMALGIPTICYIRQDLVAKYPKLPPLINADIYSLRDTIKDLYYNRHKLEKYKNLGPKYAYEFHHPSRLSLMCLEYYEKC